MKHETMSRAQAIREIAMSMPPGTSSSEITRRCMETSLWPKESDEACIFKARHSEVRKELNNLDPDGLPFGFLEEREEEIVGVETDRDEEGEIENVRTITQGYFWGREYLTVELAKKCIRQHIGGINERAAKLGRWIAYFEERWPKQSWGKIAKDQLNLSF